MSNLNDFREFFFNQGIVDVKPKVDEIKKVQILTAWDSVGKPFKLYFDLEGNFLKGQ